MTSLAINNLSIFDHIVYITARSCCKITSALFGSCYNCLFFVKIENFLFQRNFDWIQIFCLYTAEVESRTQGSRPRPRTQKNPRPRRRTAFPKTDTLEAKDRIARGQGQGPRTQAQVRSSKKKKRSSQKFFKKKRKGLHKNFPSDLHEKTFSKEFFKRSTKF